VDLLGVLFGIPQEQCEGGMKGAINGSLFFLLPLSQLSLLFKPEKSLAIPPPVTSFPFAVCSAMAFGWYMTETIG